MTRLSILLESADILISDYTVSGDGLNEREMRGFFDIIKIIMEVLDCGVRKLGLYLSADQLGQFDTYYRELIDWNRRVNLTRITGYEEVQVKHFLDSLTVVLALKRLSEGGSCRVIDVGTGAGLPGIPLRIVFPDIRLVLLEATSKKAEFLKHLITKLGLDNTEIVVGRAEEIAHNDRYREEFDVVLSRAVASLPTLAELTLPFCTIGGSFIAQKSGDIDKELSRAERAIALLGGKLHEVKAVNLDEFSDERYLIVINKVQPTPPGYPRRSGVPARRPIIT